MVSPPPGAAFRLQLGDGKKNEQEIPRPLRLVFPDFIVPSPRDQLEVLFRERYAAALSLKN